MPEVVVDEEDLASGRRKRHRQRLSVALRENVVGHHSSEGRREPPKVASVDDLDRAALHGDIVDGSPDLQSRVAVEPPEDPRILMPREVRSARGPLREEDSPVESDAVRPEHGASDAAKVSVLEPRAKERVPLELLDLAVGERRALVALAVGQVVIAPTRRVDLEEEARRLRLAEHDGIGA
jgi:hypothetical protein